MKFISRSTQKKKENWLKTFSFFKGRRCIICSLETTIPLYELHHFDKQAKESNVSRIMHHSWAKVEKELRKCVLVCSNCHKTIHYYERHIVEETNPKQLIKALKIFRELYGNKKDPDLKILEDIIRKLKLEERKKYEK
ncbi:MAG: hypothetical protein IE909_08660 [Campylobacterales bacterium]|nr:hypothetical protein [Campylobacterales bacterium]